MAFSSHSDRESYSQEMAKIRVYGEKHPLPYRRRYTTRGDYLTRTRKYDVRWPGKEAERTLPQNDSQRDSSQGKFHTVRRRLHRHSSLERIALTRSKTFSGNLPDRARVRVVK